MSKTEEDVSSLFGLSSIFWTKKSYQHVYSEFQSFHKHDVNVLFHVFTTGLGVWGAIQLALHYDLVAVVYLYAGVIALTTPWATAFLHSAFVYACLQISLDVLPYSLENPLYTCLLVMAAGYGLQDVSHWLFAEQTMMSSYIASKPAMLLIHTLWLMPLVIDSVLLRHFFLPKLLVNRNRNIFVPVASRQEVEGLRKWINTNVPETAETTHVWPHQQEGTDKAVTQLEGDAGIMAGFRQVFAAHHFDIQPIVGMNEIYVTAVGAKREITSDAVFYTPHTDGPYWFLPFASCYRVLVGVTPNTMVRTRFNLQHDSQDRVLDYGMALGFDYSR